MKIVKLSEICTDIIDCPHSTPKWLDKGIPVVRNFNLIDGIIDFSNLSYVDEETYKVRTRRANPEEGDIIISREAPMGVVGIVPPNFKCCLGQRLVLLKIDKEKYDPYYVLYALMSKYVQTQIHRVDKTGSIVSNLNIPDLENLNIPVVDIMQKEKADILKNIEENIQVNNEIIHKLNHLGDTLYNYYFIQFALSNEKLVYSEILKRNIPRWDIVNILEICDMQKGSEPGSDNYLLNLENNVLPFYRVSDLDDKKPIYVYYNDKYSFVNYDEVLVSFDGSVGRVGIGFKGFYSSGIKKIVSLKKEISNGLLYFMFRSEYIKKTIEKYATGTVLKHASSSIPYIFLPYKNTYYEEFSLKINPIYMEIVNCKKENDILKEYYNFLLPLIINEQIQINGG